MYGRWIPPKPKLVNPRSAFRLPQQPKYHKQHQAAVRRRTMHYAQQRRLYNFKRAIYHHRWKQAVVKLKSNPKAYLANKLFWYKVKWQYRYKRKAQGDKFWRFAKDY